MSIRFRWLGTACFEIVLASGEVLIIDPYMDEAPNCPVRSDEIERADLICITHGHFDHVLDVGRLANQLGSKVFCSNEVARNIRDRLDVPEVQIQAVTPGDILRRGPIRAEVVRAFHVDNRQYLAEVAGIEAPEDISTEDMVREVFGRIKDQEARERLLSYLGKYPAGEQLNFIFQFPGNIRIYFFGSTPAPELFQVAETSGAQVLILQFLRGMERSAFEVARRANPAVVIPSHHDAFFPGQRVPELGTVRSLFEAEPNMSFMEPIPGKWYEINLRVKDIFPS